MKKQPQIQAMIPVEMVDQAQQDFAVTLQTDPKYSLEPDPIGSLGFTDAEKMYLKAYVEYRNIPIAAQIAGIDEADARQLMFSPRHSAELRRINLALSCRKFSKRLLTIDEIGGYLTSMIIDDDIPACDRLDNNQKLRALDMAVKLNQIKADGFNNPKKIIEYVEVEEDAKKMDIKDIKQLISAINSPDTSKSILEKAKKNELIAKLNTGALSATEEEYLRSCPVKELEEKVANAEKFKKALSAKNLSGQSDKKGGV